MKIIKYVQRQIEEYLSENNTLQIKHMLKEYKLESYDNIMDILQVGYIKKKVIMNTKLLKHISK